MQYIFVIILLFVLELLYFRIADRFNIIDKPNDRSSHSEITLRGGGIIFPLAFLLFAIFNFQETLQHYWSFGFGLFAISVVSFIDDVKPLANRIRLLVHFVAVSLLMYFANAFQLLPVWLIPLFYIVIIGALNAYNFMDGINGITGLYSVAVLVSLLFINQNQIHFTEDHFIYYPIFAALIFLFFNFRKKAKCFAGDVGSLGIGFWVVGLIALIILTTGDYKYIFLMSIYGFDVIYTLIERIILKENIFEAHRRHLYQLLANEKGIPQLVISVGYAVVQLGINFFILKSSLSSGEIMLTITIIGSIIYLFLKQYLKKKTILVDSTN